MNTTIDRDTIKSTDDQQKDAKPPMFCIVAHANTAAFSMEQTFMIAHVMLHVGVSGRDAMVLALKAQLCGRLVVKSGLTKEVGETIMDEVNDCGVFKDQDSFNFKLEQA
jgi:hypothetical protein